MQQDIETRVAELERTNRWFFFTICGLVVALPIVAIVAVGGGITPSPTTGPFDRLVARELSIVDEQGAQIAFIGAGSNAPQPSIWPCVLALGEGRPGVILAAYEEGGFLDIANDTCDLRIAVSGVPSAFVAIRSGEDRAKLQTSGGPKLTMRDQEGAILHIDPYKHQTRRP